MITSIIDLLRSSIQVDSNRLHLPRTLLILLQIVKDLSTARLQRSRLTLQTITPEITFVLGQVYVDKVQRWRTSLTRGGDDGAALEDIDQSLLAIKILRRLLITGYEFPNRDKDVRELWNIIRVHFGDFLEVFTHGQSLSAAIRQLVGKHLIQLSKLHLEMSKVHSAAYALMPDSVSLTQAYWGFVVKFGEDFGSKSAVTSNRAQDDGDAVEEKPVLARLGLQGLLLLRSCIKMVWNPTKSFKYRQPEDKEEQKQATELMKTHLLTERLAHEMMEIIVTRFFVFRESDLRDWEDQPEEWEAREEGEGDGWEFSVRGTSEKLFLDLIIYFKYSLIKPLLAVFYTVSSKLTTPLESEVLIPILYSSCKRQHPLQRLNLHCYWPGCFGAPSASRFRLFSHVNLDGRGRQTTTRIQYSTSTDRHSPRSMGACQSVG